MFSNWHRHLLKKRAGAISLYRQLRGVFHASLCRRLDVWHQVTVIHHKRKAMAIQHLFKLHRLHTLRHAMSSIRKTAHLHFSQSSSSVLTKLHSQAEEELKALHRDEKNHIFHSSLARSRIAHIVQSRYISFLSNAVGIWARHTIGIIRSEREADRYAVLKRHLPLHFTFDRWRSFVSRRAHAVQTLFHLYKSYHLRQLLPAFNRWCRTTDSARLRRRQLERVFGRVKNVKLSAAFNTFYHATQEMMKHDINCVEQAFLNWLSFLTRRHRLKWLLVKLVSSNIKDLARETFKMWHLLAHRMADRLRFNSHMDETRTHIAHLTARSSGLAVRFHVHHEKHFGYGSVSKIFAAWRSLVTRAKQQQKMLDHHISRRSHRLTKHVFKDWSKFTLDVRYGKRFLCWMLQKSYRGTLHAFVDQWKMFTVQMAKMQLKAAAIEKSFNRVRLESAFMGFRVSAKINVRDRRMAKIIMWVARKVVTKSFHKWVCETIRLSFLNRAAVKYNQQMAIKSRSKSFAAWRSLSKFTRARNSSLDMAVSLGSNAGRRHCFHKWLKQTRYLRVMTNVEDTILWIEQKYFFAWRVWVKKFAKMGHTSVSVMFRVVSRHLCGRAYGIWRRYERERYERSSEASELSRYLLSCTLSPCFSLMNPRSPLSYSHSCWLRLQVLRLGQREEEWRNANCIDSVEGEGQLVVPPLGKAHDTGRVREAENGDREQHRQDEEREQLGGSEGGPEDSEIQEGSGPRFVVYCCARGGAGAYHR